MRVLVVEDNATTRSILQRSMQQESYEVRTADRISEALALATNEEFDVIVLDISLPDGSGVDLCRELRSGGISTPILFLTALGTVDDRIVGLDAGADDYLRKPFSIAELKARVRALGRRRGAPAAQRLIAGTVTIDLQGRRLERDGIEIPLTAREWSVLEALVAQPNQAIARAELLRHIWSSEDAQASQSLDVIMSRLRRKLGSPESGVTLVTERGFGYRLTTPPGASGP